MNNINICDSILKVREYKNSYNIEDYENNNDNFNDNSSYSNSSLITEYDNFNNYVKLGQLNLLKRQEFGEN